MKLGAIVQARMSSARLPGKVLREAAGKPMLAYLLERLARCAALDTVVVATSSEASDDPVVCLCEGWGVRCFRGDLKDVAGRFLGVVDEYGFDAFARVNGDSPLMDPRNIEKAAGIFASGAYDVVTNVLERTYPKGQSVEIVRSAAFRRAYERMASPDEKEHVTKHFYGNRGDYRIFNFRWEPPCGEIQLTVDTLEDFEVFATMVSMMERPQWEYGMEEVLELRRKALERLNR